MKEIFTAASVDEAKALAAESFGVSAEEIEFNVLEEPKKGLFGKIKGEAKVEAVYNAVEAVEAAPAAPAATVYEEPTAEEPAEAAPAVPASENDAEKTEASVKYIRSILDKMGLSEVEIEASAAEGGVNIEIRGEEFYELIGKKGELLDALQYLSSLVCNKIDREYFRITTDCGGFRDRRKAQLERLAHKLANNVKKSGRTHSLEPMNPYERRIIHAAVSEVEGVTSKSVGEEPYRKVVISSTEKRPYNGGYKGKGGRRGGNNRRSKPKPHYDITTSFEKNYKKPKPEDDMDLGSGAYGKIEF